MSKGLDLKIKEEINVILGIFNQTIDDWISELESYRLEKLLLKPTPESWSLGQLYIHLIDQTKYYFEQIEDCLDQNASTEWPSAETHPAPAHPDQAKADAADSDDLARVYRFDLAQDSEMISPTLPI